MLLAELVGAVLLAGVVVGSGILAVQLSDGNDAIALLGNTTATGAILWVLVAILGPVSGAHLNPAVTLSFYLRKDIGTRRALMYVIVQVAGCVLGAWLAHLMFDLPVLQLSSTERSGGAMMLSEAVATFTLVFAIFGAIRYAPNAIPAAVALAITAGYWWTASTSFANPAISIARSLSDTFAGVRPTDVPGFVLAQLAGAVVATFVSLVVFSFSEDLK